MKHETKIISIDSFIYLFMYFLFIIIMIPKTIQLPLIIVLSFLLIKKNNYKVWTDKTGLLFSLVGFIQILSILLNMFIDHDITRVVASINTACLWIAGGIIYSSIKKRGIDIQKVNKAMYINMSVLIILAIMMIIFVKIGKTDIHIFSRSLMRKDWLYNQESYRLRAFLLYDTLVPMLYFLIFPFAYEFLLKKKNKMYTTLYTIISFLPLYLSKSRTGILIGFLLFVYLFVSFILHGTINKRKKMILISLVTLAVLLVIGLEYEKIYTFIYGLINSREGSSSMRGTIYINSIKKTINTSPLIGCGIKDLIGDYPLGSHSTYIGLFYKVGIIGIIVGISALISFFEKGFKLKKYYLISSIALSIMLFTEDIDGENWLIVLFTILYGLIAYKNNIEKYGSDSQ